MSNILRKQGINTGGGGGDSLGEQHTVTGNPLSFTTDSAQVSNKTIVSLEPIQAGSGDPSPSNVRTISGYDSINIDVPRKNLFSGKTIEQQRFINASGVIGIDTDYNISEYIVVEASSTITLSKGSTQGNSPAICWFDANKNFINGEAYSSRETITINLPDNAKFVRFSVGNQFVNTQLEYGSTATTYEPYNPATDITIPAPDGTIYGGTLDVESGELVVDRKMIDLGSLNWTYNSQLNMFYSDELSYYNDIKNSDKCICSCYKQESNSDTFRTLNNAITIAYFYTPGVNVRDSRYTSASDLKTALNGQKYIVELATPKTYHLSPHQVKLLQEANIVTTNGTSLSLTYRDGEVAGLDDLSRLAESVEGIGSIVDELNSNTAVINVSNEFVVDAEHYTKNYLWAYKVGKIISFWFDITPKQNVSGYQPGPMITTPYSFPSTPIITRTNESGDYKFDASTTNLVYAEGAYIKILDGISGKSYQGQATLLTLN